MKKTSKDLHKNEIKEIYRKLVAYGKKWKTFEDYAEDFAQESIIEIVAGRSATFRQLYIDFLRRVEGDKRLSSFSKRQRTGNTRGFEERDSTGCCDFSIVSDYTGTISGVDRGKPCVNRASVAFYRRKIERQLNFCELIVFKMKYVLGKEDKKIALVLAVTAGRVSQINKKINEKIKEIYALSNLQKKKKEISF